MAGSKRGNKDRNKKSEGPKPGGSPEPHKEPNWREDPEAYKQRAPRWQFQNLDVSGSRWFSWDRIDTDKLRTVIKKLRELEQNTWAEILFRDRSKNHEVGADEINKQAQKRLNELELDVDTLVSIRIDGASRVWGIRNNEVCQILWWDPDHKVWQTNRAGN